MQKHASDTRYVHFMRETLLEAESAVTAWRHNHPTWVVTRIDYDFDEERGDLPRGWWVDIESEQEVSREMFEVVRTVPDGEHE